MSSFDTRAKTWHVPIIQSVVVEQTASSMVTMHLSLGRGAGRYNTRGASFVYTLPRDVARDLLVELTEALRP